MGSLFGIWQLHKEPKTTKNGEEGTLGDLDID